jgi:hypothetical protein
MAILFCYKEFFFKSSSSLPTLHIAAAKGADYDSLTPLSSVAGGNLLSFSEESPFQSKYIDICKNILQDIHILPSCILFFIIWFPSIGS